MTKWQAIANWWNERTETERNHIREHGVMTSESPSHGSEGNENVEEESQKDAENREEEEESIIK